MAMIGILWQNVLMEGNSFSAKNVCHSMLQSSQEYLKDNIYVSVGSRICRQCVGIAMGTDCVTISSELIYEYRYMRNSNLVFAERFNNEIHQQSSNTE